jgi:hypothetical protein
MVSAGYSGLEVSPGPDCFVCCTDPPTRENSRSLGRLLGRAAAVSAIYERSERMGSSTNEARCVAVILVEIKANGSKWCPWLHSDAEIPVFAPRRNLRGT